MQYMQMERDRTVHEAFRDFQRASTKFHRKLAFEFLGHNVSEWVEMTHSNTKGQEMKFVAKTTSPRGRPKLRWSNKNDSVCACIKCTEKSKGEKQDYSNRLRKYVRLAT